MIRRGRPKRCRAGAAEPRLLRLFAALQAAGGDLAQARRHLGVSRQLLMQYLSILRREGRARSLVLFDPSRTGRPCEVRLRLRMETYDRADLAALEADLGADPAVMAAAMITGAWDYEVVAFHVDMPAARRWAQQFGERADVSRIEMSLVRTLHGHTLSGFVLRGRP